MGIECIDTILVEVGYHVGDCTKLRRLWASLSTDSEELITAENNSFINNLAYSMAFTLTGTSPSTGSPLQRLLYTRPSFITPKTYCSGLSNMVTSSKGFFS